jgi:hypothetical protein
MFSYFLALVTLSPAFAAAPMPGLPAAGTYQYAGEFEVRMKLRYEVVRTMNDEGRVRFEQLRKERYECRVKMPNTYLCKQFQSTEGAAELLRSRAERTFGSKPLVFGEKRGEPGLESEGMDRAEYKVPQRASFDGRNWEYYFLARNQDRWSIRLGEVEDLTEYFSLENGELYKTEDVSVTESRNVYYVYPVKARFPKKQ